MKKILNGKHYSKDLVESWADFIDWKARRKGENGFLKETLERFKCKKVFEACLGDGCDSIYLLKEGFDVTSNDLDIMFIKKAQQNARKEKVKLYITGFDWRELDKKFEEESFDSVICLGNSLTHLFDEENQLKTLANFYKIIKKKGVLIIDERNYQYMLDNKEKILNENFRYSGKVVYCGKNVKGYPVKISDKKVVMEYFDKIRNKKFQLSLYPFKKGELYTLLCRAGFKKIQQFSDYIKGFNSKADFYTYVCMK